jgi:predicted phosphoribosyltransferase
MAWPRLDDARGNPRATLPDPAAIVIAVPVAAATTCAEFAREVDDIICASTPEPFHAVGLWYVDFTQTTDREVCDLLARSSKRPPELRQESHEAQADAWPTSRKKS